MADAPTKPIGSALTSPWTLLGGLAVVLVLAIGAVFAMTRGRWQAAVQRELALVAAAGEPISVTELEAFHAPAPGERNVAEAWLAAFDLVDSAGGFSDKTLPILSGGGTPLSDFLASEHPDWLPGAEAFLAQRGRGLAALHAAAKAPGVSSFPLDWSGHYYMLLEHVQRIRASARLFQLQGLVCVARGDAAGVRRSVEAIHAVGATLENEAVAVSQLVRYVCDRMACELAAAAIGRVEFSAADLVELQQEFSTIKYRDGVVRALIGDRALGRIAFQAPDGARALHDEKGSAWLDPLWRATSASDQALYLETMRKIIAAAHDPPAVAVAKIQAIVAEVDARIDGSTLAEFQYAGAANSMRFQLQVVVKAADAAARNRAAAAALALELMRREHGSRPVDLAALRQRAEWLDVGDPWSDRPLRWKQDGEEHVIYSIGVDGRDDFGEERLENGYPQGEPDVAVAFRLAPAVGAARQAALEEE